jgi:hypothetical protein
MASVDGKVQRKNVSIIVLDADGVTEVTRWDLIGAWPSEWRGAPLDTLQREVAIERLTLVFESLQRTSANGSGELRGSPFWRRGERAAPGGGAAPRCTPG